MPAPLLASAATMEGMPSPLQLWVLAKRRLLLGLSLILLFSLSACKHGEQQTNTKALETLRVRSSLTLLDNITASSSACVLVCCSPCLQAASENNKISDNPSKRRRLAKTHNWRGEGIPSIVAALAMSGVGMCRED